MKNVLVNYYMMGLVLNFEKTIVSNRGLFKEIAKLAEIQNLVLVLHQRQVLDAMRFYRRETKRSHK